ncbi:sialate O-acetylesterase [Mucilaginibacter myungsuensis]|uniref:Sialate O-acetylesterase n=1 Tax=Mucilaginibacter myungsuensis TaxID=649104 RepID=A0A929L0P4_9SPHI|nr:sialate O-acetylesterase [Mucilaginibacter myungsuensis]MBE9663973.1 sialate O-acetylesterase [Mucilaginibacter myungsuensis]MDN3601152.1 sialate O-acetylesterase [Mucilaginibacter myungsuensis]
MSKARYIVILLILLFPGLLSAQIRANVVDTASALIVADPLQSNMVIQQNKPFKVWGHAPAGKIVTVKASWLTVPVSVQADRANKFMAIINVPAIQKGNYTKHSIGVTYDSKNVILDNLLIGDVWFCSGQSNMQFAVREIADPQKHIDSAVHPNIRLLNVRFTWKIKPTDTIPGKWLECSPQNVRDFSAVGYYFAREIQRKLDIPIGVIYSGIGGSVTQAYLAQDVMAADPLLKAKYLDPFYQTDAYKKSDLEKFTFGTTSYPYLIYNGMIYPFFNLSVKGILWYQGESNREQRDEYVKLNQTMIESWRKGFGQGSLPFYYVQVAPHAYGKMDTTLNDYAFFREQQERIATLNNTAMVTTMDVGDKDDIHPKNKKPIGLRLAYTALNQTYAQLDIAYRGPQYSHAVYGKQKATVYFEPGTTDKGLATTDNKSPRHFYLAGEDQVFHRADARIDGNTIVLDCKEVKKPVAVRYAFTNFPTTNLQNGAGIPAVPFRTDNWAEPVQKGTTSK